MRVDPSMAAEGVASEYCWASSFQPVEGAHAEVRGRVPGPLSPGSSLLCTLLHLTVPTSP